MKWKVTEIGGQKLWIPEYEHKTEQVPFTEKHPFIANILQAELIVAGLLTVWFLITFSYHFGFFTYWEIPYTYLEIDLVRSTKFEIVFLLAIFLILYIISVNIYVFFVFLKRKNELLSNILLVVLMILYLLLTLIVMIKGEIRLSFLVIIPIVIIGFIFSTVKMLKIGTRLFFATISTLFFLFLVYSLPTTNPQKLPVIYLNGNPTNQVIMTTFRDYYIVGYYDGKKLYPCYELKKIIDDEKLQTVHGSLTGKKRSYVYEQNKVIVSNGVLLRISQNWKKENCQLRINK
ncbi:MULTISPECIES: hypothetical protein [unclassified Thermoactinomyces]|uniref:hypothetical protein n=1 Tax=unclassified Thermoactinomyces TaxID=2634588 RepID=UPI0018DC989D|nr:MULTISPECIES: hypothetical protein [unclassified Thermoactinomyces]MBH8605789.1 hypothetical protein [Thermoactinomyces sp. CICC 10522]MBH8608879.1 hypothetical protein [Thermoactinomyces sp. CICC 10521]